MMKVPVSLALPERAARVFACPNAVFELPARIGVAAACAAAVPILTLVLASADAVALVRTRVSGRVIWPPPDLTIPLAERRASIVIVNWNGRHLLERGIPSLLSALAGTDHEVLIVDNGSTDGSVALIRDRYPEVRLIALPSNLGFSAGTNVGARAARHDILVTLNSDMVVARDFLDPLIAPFADGTVFATGSQVFFQDGTRRREESGRTRARFTHGMLEAAHVGVDTDMESSQVPVLWVSGGAAAYDRRKFLALGGFDELYSPAYVEDLALSCAAWKSGWQSVFVGRSKVFHEHRATSRRLLGDRGVDLLARRNTLLFLWRWLGWGLLLRHLAWLPANVVDAASQFGAAGAASVLFRALVRTPLVWRKRALDSRPACMQDSEILAIGWRPEECEEFDSSSGIRDVRVRTGWYGIETDKLAYRWMGRTASVFFRTGAHSAAVRVTGHVPLDLVRRGAVSLTLRAGQRELSRVLRDAGAIEEELPVGSVGEGWSELELAIGRTFCPARDGTGSDRRELGLQIFQIVVINS